MLHKEQLDIFLTALLFLLVKFCIDLKELALEFRTALSGRNWTVSNFTNEDR